MERDSGCMAESYDINRLRAKLGPMKLHFFARLRSTNDHAAAMRKQRRLFAPAVVLTSHQTAGRGRGSNRWWSDESVMTATFAFAAEENMPAGELPLIAGLAVRDAAAELTGCNDVQLKWPNDVLHDGRKIAGLLCERGDKLDLIGVGLNVNLDPAEAPRDLRAQVGSLLLLARKRIDPTEALLVLASHLKKAMLARRKQPFGVFLREYEKHHALLGRRVTIQGEPGSPAITGKVEGVDSHARLLVRDLSVLHHVVAGHVVMS